MLRKSFVALYGWRDPKAGLALTRQAACTTERPHLVVSGSVISLPAGGSEGGAARCRRLARGAAGHLVVSDSVIWLSAGGAVR